MVDKGLLPNVQMCVLKILNQLNKKLKQVVVDNEKIIKGFKSI